MVERVREGRNREAQVVRYTRRKLFNRARRQVFLDWFGATCNMGWASEKAGVSYKTVSKHIRKDPEFAAEVHEAMQLGVLRAKAKLIETKKRETAIRPDGEEEVPDLDMPHAELIQSVREHDRTLILGRKPGRAPRIASNEEVLAALTRRVKAMWRRCERRHGRDGSAPPPAPDGEGEAEVRAGEGAVAKGPLHHVQVDSPPDCPALSGGQGDLSISHGHARVQTAPGSPQPVRGTRDPSIPRAGEERE